ncbi:glycosyltransferase family 4 protein [Bradyrhizobium sp. 2S1]|uniref:glycosyltransferase family 4 protein n=1 Tax=Bradyrhizobium sp. 2S1 TaxID=1404429 RepID=UPI00140DC021|nr:glycosyltransferase family 4 protein [Bradyrhizobium sp. 2S1]MCK7670919.1 glycosyltransferase family 4 protein [Bradyrhizobium sp. 2S1]
MGPEFPKPRLGRSAIAKAGRVLFIAYFEPHGTGAIIENIAFWQQHSRYDLEVVNLWPTRGPYFTLPHTVRLEDYDAVLIHCTVSYNPDNAFSLDSELARGFSEYDGVKVLMKQDEQVRTARFAEFLRAKSFDAVISCVPPGEVERVYPRAIIGDVTIHHALTGYVSSAMLQWKRQPLSGRTFDATYRGSLQPLEFGQLGFDKRKIAYDLSRLFDKEPDIHSNISCRWEDRLSGNDWVSFLQESRIVIGTESGANLFDFDGNVAAWCRNFEKTSPNSDRWSEAFYCEAHDAFLHKYEGNVHYAQVSPRHFEAAAAGAAQILYRGDYSDLFHAGIHYFPLERDLSNAQEMFEFIKDQRAQAQMAERAYEDIIANPRNTYLHFVDRFDNMLETCLTSKGLKQKAARKAEAVQARTPDICGPKAVLLVPHRVTLDPRVQWLSASLQATFDVCELAAYAMEGASPLIERVDRRSLRVSVDDRRHDWTWLQGEILSARRSPGIDALRSIYLAATLPASILGTAFGAIDASAADLNRFRHICQHFLRVNGALIQAGRALGPSDVIIACDLDTLPAAAVLAEESGARLVYDAHEYWPYAIQAFRHWECEFWVSIDRGLAANADLRSTVSPPLAALMSDTYGMNFFSVPNCVPLSQALPGTTTKFNDEIIEYLYQGIFAPGRGLEELIDAFVRTTGRIRLKLRGPDGNYKDELRARVASHGANTERIQFAPSLTEEELIPAASQSHVGIIPYLPSNINNKFCSPNKLSQYLAAGLPIVSNDLEFVKQVVVGNGLGLCIDFTKPDVLATALDKLAEDRPTLEAMSVRALDYFRRQFNWEAQSAQLVNPILQWADTGDRKTSAFDVEALRQAGAMTRNLSQLGTVLPLFPTDLQPLQLEIDRLNQVYPDEIKRIAEIYVGQIQDLQRTVGDLTTRIAKLQAGQWATRPKYFARSLAQKLLPSSVRRFVGRVLGHE